MISQLLIRDFQSHEDTAVAFARGYNCIVGPTDVGKSACLRALRWALCNDLSGTKFIRNSGVQATVSITFDDTGTVTRFKSRKTANGYQVDALGKGQAVYDKIGDAVPAEVAAVTKTAPVQVDGDWTVFPFFQGQFEAPFLIAETPSRRAKLLHRLSYSHIVDEALRTTRQDLLGLTKRKNELAQRKTELVTELGTYKDLDLKLEAAGKLQALLQQKQEAEGKTALVASLKGAFAQATLRLSRAQETLNRLQLCSVESLLASLDAIARWLHLQPQFRQASERQEKARAVVAKVTLDPATGATLDTYYQWGTVFQKYGDAQGRSSRASASLQFSLTSLEAIKVEVEASGVCPTCSQLLPKESMAHLLMEVA